jgi:hypothetical protein
MSKTVHIVCLDAPSPADYGGAIDMFCKIKTLAQSGVSILLHYFDYKPERHANDVLDDCAQVFSYKRKPFLIVPIFFKTPYCCLTNQYGI